MKLIVSRPEVAMMLAALETHEDWCRRRGVNEAVEKDVRALRRKLWKALQKALGNEIDEATGTVVR
jgi:hypothetical protein